MGLNDEKETGRIEAFSDGVFAVAITLLALDIHIPEFGKLDGRGLGPALLAQWPMYLAYAASFSTILIMWINHHRLFEHIHRKDHLLLLYNGLLLMVITLIPFPTALLAQYIQHPGAKIAAAVFSGTYLLMAVVFNLLWRHAARDGRLLAENHDKRKVQHITDQFRFGPLLYVVVFAFSFVSVGVAVAMSLALSIFFALPEKPPQD